MQARARANLCNNSRETEEVVEIHTCKLGACIFAITQSYTKIKGAFTTLGTWETPLLGQLCSPH